MNDNQMTPSKLVIMRKAKRQAEGEGPQAIQACAEIERLNIHKRGER